MKPANFCFYNPAGTCYNGGGSEYGHDEKNVIRKFREADTERVAEIWLASNLSAHSFIPAEYWESRLAMVKELFSQAEIYVWCETGRGVCGFIGLNGSFVEGLFVCEEMRSRGIGKRLLDHVKSIKGTLCLQVYRKNARAVLFYLREGFRMQQESTDEETGEQDITMIWNRTPEAGQK